MSLKLQKNIGFLTLALLCILPVLRWIFIAPLDLRFLSLGTTMTSLGQITGLLGITAFSLVLILSGRFKISDKYFYGLNKVYEHHHKLGAVAFSLLLFHPLFLAFNYIMISVHSAALFLLPSGDLAVTYGIISLGLMILLIVLTFYAKMKYQNWKFSHKFMVLVFIFAILHTMLISSDISRDLILRYYIFSLAFIGLAVSFYQAFIKIIVSKNFIYNLKRITALNQTVWELEMEPVSGPMPYEAGQFVFIRFHDKKISAEQHPFSITSAPAEKNLNLIIKNLGDYTSQLEKLSIGSLAKVEGPFGKFSFKNIQSKKQIWLAGGIGITPFYGLAKTLDSDYEVDLYYSVGQASEAVKVNELSRLASANKNFRFIPWFTNEKGRITAIAIQAASNGLDEKEILLCGPSIFMNSLKDQFVQLGVSSEKIHWEMFNFL